MVGRDTIALALFATTKGHYGHTDIYKETVEDLLSQFDDFDEKVVHIKRNTGEDLVYEEMCEFFTLKGFTILSTPGEWKHFHISHYTEHAKDITTLMESQEVQSCKYVLWLEDDFLLRTIDTTLKTAMSTALSYLEVFPSLLNVRFLKDTNDETGLDYSPGTPGSIRRHRDVYSFNPHIARSRDVWFLSQNFRKYYQQYLHVHIERFATEMMKSIVPEHQKQLGPFGCFSLNWAKAVHIGTEDYEKGKYGKE